LKLSEIIPTDVDDDAANDVFFENKANLIYEPSSDRPTPNQSKQHIIQ